MNDPIVSIIVPVYNVKEYLPRCLDSLISQTLKNIEIITIDDGSTDGSSDLLDLYSLKDERIRVIHVQNGGLASARNIGLGASKGEFVGFVDSDDYVDSQMFSIMVDVAEKYKADCVQCDLDVVGNHGELLKAGDSKGSSNYDLPESVVALMRQEIIPSVCVKVFRRASILNAKFCESWRQFAEDFKFTAEFLLNGGKISIIPNVLYHYYSRGDSITHKAISEDVLHGLFVFDLLKKSPHLPETVKKITAEKELSETLNYLNSSIGHDNIRNRCIWLMIDGIKANHKYISRNEFLNKKEKAMARLVCLCPRLYIKMVSLYKKRRRLKPA